MQTDWNPYGSMLASVAWFDVFWERTPAQIIDYLQVDLLTIRGSPVGSLTLLGRSIVRGITPEGELFAAEKLTSLGSSDMHWLDPFHYMRGTVRDLPPPPSNRPRGLPNPFEERAIARLLGILQRREPKSIGNSWARQLLIDAVNS